MRRVTAAAPYPARARGAQHRPPGRDIDEARPTLAGMDRTIGAWLLAAGIVIALVGLAAMGGWLSWFGRLPGDIRYEGEHTTVHVPITSMLLLSLAATVVLNVIGRLR